MLFNVNKLAYLLGAIGFGVSLAAPAADYGNHLNGHCPRPTITRTITGYPPTTTPTNKPTTTSTTSTTSTTPTTPTTTWVTPTTTPTSPCTPTIALYENTFDIAFFPTPYIRLNYSPNHIVTSGRGIAPLYPGDQYGLITTQDSPLEITAFTPSGPDPRYWFDAYFLRVGCVGLSENQSCSIRITGTKVAGPGGGGPGSVYSADVTYSTADFIGGELMFTGLVNDDMHEPSNGEWSGLGRLTIGLTPGQSDLGPDVRVVIDGWNYLWGGCLTEGTP